MRQPRMYTIIPVILALLVLALSQFSAAAEETVCVQCHSALPEKYSTPVKQWTGSIHAENGIACHACHGGNPKDAANAMNRARGFLGAPRGAEIPPFCGRCHVGVLKDYQASAHGRALGKGGPTCVTCHGNHRVVKASLDIINEKTCSQCHTFERAQKIKSVMQEIEGIIVTNDSRIAAFKQKGIDTEQLEKGLFSVRNSFHTLFHNVDVTKVTSESARIKSELKKLSDRLQALDDEQSRRKLAGGIVVSAFLLLAVVLHLIKKTFE